MPLFGTDGDHAPLIVKAGVPALVPALNLPRVTANGLLTAKKKTVALVPVRPVTANDLRNANGLRSANDRRSARKIAGAHALGREVQTVKKRADLTSVVVAAAALQKAIRRTGVDVATSCIRNDSCDW